MKKNLSVFFGEGYTHTRRVYTRGVGGGRGRREKLKHYQTRKRGEKKGEETQRETAHYPSKGGGGGKRRGRILFRVSVTLFWYVCVWLLSTLSLSLLTIGVVGVESVRKSSRLNTHHTRPM